MEFEEGVGESSSPPRSCTVGGGGGGSVGGGGNDGIRTDVYNRLMEDGNEEAVNDPDFRERLEVHFSRLPQSYGQDINMDRVEDVLLHQKLLAWANDPDNQPAFHIRFLEVMILMVKVLLFPTPQYSHGSANDPSSNVRNRSSGGDFETCSKLEDLNLDIRLNYNDMNTDAPAEEFSQRHDNNPEAPAEDFSQRHETLHTPIHEIIFSTIDKPKLLSQLSALLSDIGLNIREAHVFSTTDGYSLDVFVVDGWHVEGIRPEIREDAHPKLRNLMQRCCVDLPGDRPLK